MITSSELILSRETNVERKDMKGLGENEGNELLDEKVDDDQVRFAEVSEIEDVDRKRKE